MLIPNQSQRVLIYISRAPPKSIRMKLTQLILAAVCAAASLQARKNNHFEINLSCYFLDFEGLLGFSESNQAILYGHSGTKIGVQNNFQCADDSCTPEEAQFYKVIYSTDIHTKPIEAIKVNDDGYSNTWHYELVVNPYVESFQVTLSWEANGDYINYFVNDVPVYLFGNPNASNSGKVMILASPDFNYLNTSYLLSSRMQW